MPDVVLTVNDRKYDGWQRVRVRLGMERGCGHFSLALTERWAGQNEPWPISPEDECTLAIDGTMVITGIIDDVLPRFDRRNHGIRVTGRDTTSDMIDSSAANTPGRWTNRTLTQIAAAICHPFGVSVSVAKGADIGGPFKTFALQPGETAWEAIERLCRFRGVLPVADGLGGLFIVVPGTDRASVRLVEGENILSGSGMLTRRGRHSIYTVKGMAVGLDESTPEQNASPVGTAIDPDVKRHRPLTLIAEEPSAASELQKRARWEAAVRRGRSRRAAITVQGWSHPGGLWRINTNVHVTSPWLRLDRDMLVSAVTLMRDDGSGTLSHLELCPPEGLMPIEIPETGGELLWS